MAPETIWINSLKEVVAGVRGTALSISVLGATGGPSGFQISFVSGFPLHLELLPERHLENEPPGLYMTPTVFCCPAWGSTGMAESYGHQLVGHVPLQRVTIGH